MTLPSAYPWLGDPAIDAVRLAQPDDIPQLVELMIDFYAEAGYPLPAEAATRTFAALVDDPRLGHVWMMEADGDPAGYVVLTVSFSMEYGGLRGFVDDLFVRPGFRGRGLAAAALAELRRTAEALGVRALLVEVGPDNDTARRVYQRLGLEDTGHVLLSLPLAAPVHLA
ncbi:L-amino acid N-acyltransferase YncA [bacterium JGI 053]|nr:L-amino acid N-acyltransferase YncA [bacterium JGI 053]